jgi:putative effector of murein hydrolase LrgA (UPF0299 family)
MTRIYHVLLGWVAILGCYFAGKAIVLVTGLLVPAPLVGLLLLFGLLQLHQRPPEILALAAQPLLKHMSILFVPAVLGVGLYWDSILANIWSLAGAIILSTIVCMGFTAWFAQWLFNRNGNAHE